MRKYLAGIGLMLLAVTAQAGEEFVSQLSPADFTAAGLQKQTPEELARLKALIEQYKSGELAKAQRAATLARQEAERKIVAAETKTREAEIKTQAAETKVRTTEAKEIAGQAAANTTKKQPGWFTALITLRHAGEKPEREQPLSSRLVGEFNGWHGRTTFTFEDGTRWQQQNVTDRYDFAPALSAPKVQIKPASLAGFWLEIEGVNLSVRVVPVELGGLK